MRGCEGLGAGGLISYGVNEVEMWRRSATFVDKILKGTNPADLPAEEINTFEMVINLRAAQSIGLTTLSRCCYERTRSYSRPC